MNRTNLSHKLLMLMMALSLSVTGLMTSGAPALAQAQVDLSLVPSVTPVPVGGTFTVNIVVTPQAGQAVTVRGASAK